MRRCIGRINDRGKSGASRKDGRNRSNCSVAVSLQPANVILKAYMKRLALCALRKWVCRAGSIGSYTQHHLIILNFPVGCTRCQQFGLSGSSSPSGRTSKFATFSHSFTVDCRYIRLSELAETQRLCECSAGDG